MTGRTHDLFAFALLLTIAVFYLHEPLTITTLFLCLIANIIGALIPDIDQASNKLWDLLPAGEVLGHIVDKLFLSHRTISHSLLGSFIVYWLLQLSLPNIFNPQSVNVQLIIYSTMIGFVSHLLADSLTKDGIPLFFPFKFRFGIPPISALRITTGSWVEKLLIFPGLVIYLCWFIYTYQATLLEIIKNITG